MKSKYILAQFKTLAFTGLGALAFASLALADDTTSGYTGLETMEEPQVEQLLQVSPAFTYIVPAEIHHTDVDISTLRFDVPVHYTIKTDPGDLRLGTFYEHSKYILEDNPNQNFNTLTFDLLWKAMINDNWGYFAYGAVGFSTSTHADFGDGLTGIGGGGVRYVWSENLSLGLGAAVATRMEDDPLVLPIIALNWQIDDRWNLRVLNGATISYDVSGDKKFLVDLGAKYQRREYRTKDALGTTGNGSLIDKMITVEVGATYNFTPKFGLRGFVGVSAGRNIEARENNDKAWDEDVDAAPFVGARAFITF